MPSSRNLDLSRNRILAGLPAEEMKRLLPHLQFVPLSLGEVLDRSGGPLKYAYFPQDAVVSLLATLRDGRSVEVTLVGAEGMLGIRAALGAKTGNYKAVVQIPGGCLRMKVE